MIPSDRCEISSKKIRQMFLLPGKKGGPEFRLAVVDSSNYISIYE